MCLYTNNKQFKKEIKKEIPITRALRAIKYLGTFYLEIKYFAKEAKKKKYTLKAIRRLLKEIKDNENNGKTFHIHELEDLILLKGFPSGSVVKNLPASAGDVGSISG